MIDLIFEKMKFYIEKDNFSILNLFSFMKKKCIFLYNTIETRHTTLVFIQIIYTYTNVTVCVCFFCQEQKKKKKKKY